ncbi:PIN domain-containing protein [Candidatus Micrarchaeota archaeon]|nr:PIN domain-containing protein [Candidatus Micrarchaeota archaeon]
MGDSKRIFIDSGVWIALFDDHPGASQAERILENNAERYCSLLTLYEVLRYYQQRKPKEVEYVGGQIKNRSKLIGLDEGIVFHALQLKLRHPQFSTVDALSLATARKLNATLVTRDSDFKGIADTRVIKTE